MAKWFFNAPGNLSDFSDPTMWHKAMAKEAHAIIVTLVAAILNKEEKDVTPKEIETNAPLLGYFDPTLINPPDTAKIVGIAPWGAFPRAVERRAPWNLPHDPDDIDGILRASEDLGDEDFRPGKFTDFDGKDILLPVRHRQDEYLEWVVRKNKEGKITKIIFVAEGYDYFSALFKHDPKLVVELYKQFTEVNTITADDLIAKRGIKRINAKGRVDEVVQPGEFNPRNAVNINPGIVHLSHRANSLSAEVNLAGVSGIGRFGVDGKLLDAKDAERLLCCSQGGNPNRNSDPLIAQQAYTQILSGFQYTLADPVGLYIAGIEENRMQLPNGDPVPSEWWTVVRGQGIWNTDNSRILRLEFEVPVSEKLTISDLTVDGDPVIYGAQIAKLLSVHLFVSRWARERGGTGQAVSCIGTCCRKKNSEELATTEDGLCDPGFDLAFPGLVNPPPPEKQTFSAHTDSFKASGSARSNNP